MCLQCWLCFTCVQEKLEPNSVKKPLLLTLMTTPLFNLGKFVHVQVSFLLQWMKVNHRITLIAGTSKAGQENNQSWKGLGQPEDRIQSHRQKSPSLILIRSTHMKTWLQKEPYI